MAVFATDYGSIAAFPAGIAVGGYGADIYSAANQYSVPPALLAALVVQESQGDPTATGNNGEIGLTQLLPSTAAELGVNPFNPTENLQGGASYLSRLFNKYGNWTAALSAYNSGSPNSTAGQGYAAKIAALANKIDPNWSSPGAVASGSGATAGSSGTPVLSTPIGNIGITGYGIAIVLVILLLAFGAWGVIREA